MTFSEIERVHMGSKQDSQCQYIRFERLQGSRAVVYVQINSLSGPCAQLGDAVGYCGCGCG